MFTIQQFIHENKFASLLDSQTISNFRVDES